MDLKFEGLFLITCSWMAITFVSGKTGTLPPPGRLSVVVIDDFCLNLTWSRPENWNSSVKYCITRVEQDSYEILSVTNTYYADCLDMENGVTYTVATSIGDCGEGDKTQSSRVNVSIANRKEKLVKDFKCHLYTHEAMNCTWTPIDRARDLQLYYRYQGSSASRALKHCSAYLHDSTDKIGCHFNGNGSLLAKNDFFFLINGTRGFSTLKNTFPVKPIDHVKPEPPVLRYSVEGNGLQLQCDPPAGFPRDLGWICGYDYRSSKSTGWQKKNSSVETPVYIPFDRSPKYQVRAKTFCGNYCSGSSDWSEITSIEFPGEEQPPDGSSYMALIAIPIVVTICVIFLLVFFKRLRALFLPEIPHPMQLVKELRNSKEEGVTAIPQSKGSERQKLYVPEEPELCTNVSVVRPELPSTP